MEPASALEIVTHIYIRDDVRITVYEGFSGEGTYEIKLGAMTDAACAYLVGMPDALRLLAETNLAQVPAGAPR